MNFKEKAVEKIQKSNLQKEQIQNSVNHIKEWYIEDMAEKDFYKELVKKFPFLKSLFQ